MAHDWLISLRSLALGLGTTPAIKSVFTPTGMLAIRESAFFWLCLTGIVLFWDARLRQNIAAMYAVHFVIILYRCGILYVCGQRALHAHRRLPCLVVRVTGACVYAVVHLCWLIVAASDPVHSCLNPLFEGHCVKTDAAYILSAAAECVYIALIIVLNAVFGYLLVNDLVTDGGYSSLSFHRNLEHAVLQAIAHGLLFSNLYSVARGWRYHDGAWRSLYLLQDALLLILMTEFGCKYKYVLKSSVPDTNEGDLELARTELDRAERNKKKIIAYLDHSCRNSLQRLTYLSDRLKDAAGVDRVETLESLRTCSAYLASVVDDVLSIDAFERGDVVLRERIYDVSAFVRSELGYLQRFADYSEKQITCDTSALPNAYEVFGDPDRVRQILRIMGENLIRRAPRQDNTGTSGTKTPLRILARVNGSLELVFECTFPQAFEPTMNDAYTLHPGCDESHDLSQALVHRILRAVHGHITLDPEGRVGRITIPLLGDLTVEVESVTQQARKFSMLLVDDSMVNRRVLKGLLKKLLKNVTCDEAEDGQQAVDMVLKEGRVYDIIFMDQVMPVKTGFEACSEIKAVLPTTTIVMVSANDVAAEPQMLGPNAADFSLRKPVTKATLTAILRKYKVLP